MAPSYQCGCNTPLGAVALLGAVCAYLHHSYEAVSTPSKRIGCNPKVMVLGMPKAGTTSLHEAFKSAGYNSVHWALPAGDGLDTDVEDIKMLQTQEGIEERLVARMVWRAANEGLPPFAYLPEDVEAVAEMNGMVFDDEVGAWGYFPQMSLLETIFETYPNAAYILNLRNMTKWVNSVNKYLRIRERMAKSDLHKLPRGAGYDDGELLVWVENHHRRVIEEAQRRGVRFLIFDIEKHGAKELSEFLGRSVSWGQMNRLEDAPLKV
eukprot:CAMPEP_0206424328 /NCGR_PEP_ID=MMETSP0324_2-20121206/3168_1 /ASSEMBLY_ACC=CAM_ASM_000836 /TAXON_ID=2866 /ORGANISM="Crypthecodinium cohnii, Strain Seligo" /LENGTH=264 /DNA_ID=CAMNT_0053888973 /DNA_START=15 /DNA_END=809 /DNA_ORIENTATION=-